MSDETTRLSYAEAGVDIAAGNALVDRIAPAAAATARPGTMAGLGGFGALFDLKAAGLPRPDPRRRDRRRGHQTADRDRYRRGRWDRPGSGGDVRQRPCVPRRGAAVLPRLLRHRAAVGRSGRAGGRGDRRRLSRGRMRAGGWRDRGDAGDVSAGRFRPRGICRGRDGARRGAARGRGRGRRGAGPRLGRGAFQRLFAGAPGGGGGGAGLERCGAVRGRVRWGPRC